MYIAYKDAQLLEHVSFQGYGGNRTLRIGDRAERVSMWFPWIDFFRALGVEPLLGRLPVAEDDGKVVLLSHRLWTSAFGGDPDVIGSTVEADGAVRTVIGVMKPDFWLFNDGFLLWAPYEITPQMIEEPGESVNRLVARMKPGVTTEMVAEELTQLARGLPERFGGSPAYARILERHRAVVRPLEEVMEATAHPPRGRRGVAHCGRRGGRLRAVRAERGPASAGLLPAGGTHADELADRIARVRGEDVPSAVDRARDPRARPSGRAGRPDLPDQHDGRSSLRARSRASS